MSILKYICTFILISASNFCYATLIIHGDYELDTDTNIITNKDTGLQWLQWDYTLYMSIDSALSSIANTYEGGGWELATNSQMADLFNYFDLGHGTVWDSIEQTDQRASDPVTASIEAPDDPQLMFVELFGDTRPDYCNFAYNTPCSFQFSSALFGRDEDGDGWYNVAEVYDDYLGSKGEGDGYVRLSRDRVYSDRAVSFRGIALVRMVDVNAPSTIGLMTLAFFGLAFRRRFSG